MTRTRPRITRDEAGRVLSEVLGAISGAAAAGAASDILGSMLARQAGIAPAPAPKDAPPSRTRQLLDRVDRFRAHQERERLRAEGIDPDEAMP